MQFQFIITMKLSFDRRLYVLLVVASAFMVATAGMGGAAVTGTDTETTDTSYESEVQANDVRNITDNGSVAHQFTVTASNESDSAEYPALDLLNNQTGDVRVENDSAVNASGPYAAGSYFNMTVDNGDLKVIEHDQGENVTVTAQFTNNSSTSIVDHEFTFYLEYDDNRTVQVVNNSEADPDDPADAVTYESEDRFLLGENNETTVAYEDQSVNGSDTQMVVVLDNSTLLDDYDEVATDASSGARLSDAGFSVLGGADKNVVLVEADDTTYYVPLFKSEAPDDWGDDSTYAVYDEDYAGETAIRINKGSALEDVDTFDSVEVIGAADRGDHIGFFTDTVKPSDAPTSDSGILGLGVMTGPTDAQAGFASTLGLLMVRGRDVQDGRAPAFRQFTAADDGDEDDETEGPTASADSDGGTTASVEA